MVDVSIIVPVYNDEDYLNESLESVISQTLKNIEIICINDGSTDKSLNILEEYSKKDNRIIVINQDNQGSANARNKGLDIAKGEYIGFLDADDIYIDSNALETLYCIAKKHDAEMVSANLKFLTETRDLVHNHHYDQNTFYYFKNECEIKPDEYGIPFYFYKNLFKAEFIDDLRFPDLSRGQDPIFLSEILAKTDRIYGVPIDFYGYMVPTSFSKLDTYTKKYDYIYQYKQCINILNRAGLHKTSDKYVHNLILYLSDNDDGQLYSIVCDVFDNDMTYFKGYENEYESFIKSNVINRILVENSQEYYLKAKKKHSFLLDEADTISEYKIKLFKSKLESKQKEYDDLYLENLNLKNDLENEKQFNRKILNSKSWKILNMLRKTRG